MTERAKTDSRAWSVVVRICPMVSLAGLVFMAYLENLVAAFAWIVAQVLVFMYWYAVRREHLE